MDNSDDYFDDSLVLNEDDLALLDAEEAKHTQNDSAAFDQTQLNKRRKILHRPEAEDPDISLQWNGTYGVNTDFWELCGEKTAPSIGSLKLGADSGQVTQETQQERPLASASNYAGVQAKSGYNDTRSVSVSAKEVNTNIASAQTKRIPARASAGSSSAGPGVSGLQDEVALLRAQVEDMMRERDGAKNSLREFEVARFAKEGEVSILRKQVEKAAEQHAVDLRKLRETKETAETERARLQKEMKDQIERIRTEYIFKQHELDSSSRRPVSTRSKRFAGSFHPSPVPLPPAMRNWSSSRSAVRRAENENENGNSQLRVGTQEVTRQITSQSIPKFPGFENTFLQSSPTKSPARKRILRNIQDDSVVRTPRRSAARGINDGRPNGLFSPIKAPPLGMQLEAKGGSPFLAFDDAIQDFEIDVDTLGSSPSRRRHVNGVGSSPAPDRVENSSVLDSDLMEETEDDCNYETDPFQGIDWLDELHSILFSRGSDFSDALTFHFLLSAPVSSAHEYQQVCSAILEALGAKYKYLIFSNLLDDVMKSLLIMANILWKSKLYSHLGALLDLLNSVAIHIPDSAPSIARPYTDDRDSLSAIFTEISRDSIDSKNANRIDSKLTHSVLTLLETLAWLTPEHLSDRLSDIAKDVRAFNELLNDKQPTVVIKHTLQLLILFATHPSLCTSFISLSPFDGSGQPASRDAPPSTLLERLCTLLLQEKVCCGEDDIPTSVLTFFSLLLSASPECRRAVQTGTNLIPCLVLYLSRLTCVIWEDAESTSLPTIIATGVIKNMQHSLRLLHQLVFTTAANDGEGRNIADIDLRQKLYYAPPQMFNGLAHIFIVMISRLSYAEPPEWLSAELYAQVERITEPSRDLLDLIVEGPESDSIWSVFQQAEAVERSQSVDELDDAVADLNQQSSIEI